MTDLATVLANLPGVRGHAVFDAGYRCRHHQLPDGLDPTSLSLTLLQLQVAFDTFAMAQGEIEQGSVLSFVAECAGGNVALRRIGSYQIVTILDAGCDPSPLVAALDEFSTAVEENRRRGRSVEKSFDSLDSDEDLETSAGLEYYSASLETPAPLEPEGTEPTSTESIWDKDVREIVGDLGRKAGMKKKED